MRGWQRRGLPLAAAAETALIGGRVHHFSGAGAVDELVGLAGRVARLPGPAGANALVAALGGDVPLPSGEIMRGAGAAASGWTETPKSVLVLRPAFADRANNLGTRSQWEATMAEVSAWLSANSYGKTNLVVTVVNRPDIMVIGAAAVYEPTEDYARLMADAKERALLAGFNADNYDITVVAFPKLSWSWSGLATIGGRDQWLNGTRDAKTIAHEFGHNYGLRHASSWDVNDGSVMPPSGAPDAGDPRHAEYGDRYSVMGGNPGDYPQGDFSTHGKAFLNWITAGQVATVTAPGTYRVHRFDAPEAGSKPTLALKLQRADSQAFWLGYRRSFTGNSYLSNGAYLLWEYTPQQCRLLDLTPDSRTTSHYDDKEDAALAVGQTFADPTGNLYLTPIAQGGSAPDEWLDVRVEFTAGGNQPPTAAINLPPAPVPARAPVVFSATASDPDDDPLEYTWDFGYGRTASGASVSWTFTAGGTRQVKLTVSDGRGGTVEVTETVLVSDPLKEIEGVPLPVAVQLDDGALASGLHVAVSPTWPVASPDGGVWSAGPAALGFNPERLAAGGGRIVGVGSYYDGAAVKWLARTAASTDGLVWESAAPAMLPPLKGVAFRNGVFVAVGDDGAVANSTDGLGWTAAGGIPAESFRDVVATGSGFVACGTGGTVLTSLDGAMWTPRATPLAWPALSGLATDGAAVACVGMGPSYWWSADGGANWSSRGGGYRKRADRGRAVVAVWPDRDLAPQRPLADRQRGAGNLATVAG
ncbi:MAG: PKD domain-containing protein [Akkermansiaceae bacterium]|nr:PKD domain-containing protein [Akkermansiaceae bacterium]